MQRKWECKPVFEATIQYRTYQMNYIYIHVYIPHGLSVFCLPLRGQNCSAVSHPTLVTTFQTDPILLGEWGTTCERLLVVVKPHVFCLNRWPILVSGEVPTVLRVCRTQPMARHGCDCNLDSIAHCLIYWIRSLRSDSLCIPSPYPSQETGPPHMHASTSHALTTS